MDLLEQAVAERKRIHFIGVGGVMMSSLALELHRRGAVVTGSDRSESPNVELVRANGIPVSIGHKAEYVAGAAVIVRNAAIPDTSPDIAYARSAGIPVLERPQVLGHIMAEYPCSVGVSGTHGKSTTSGMLVHAMRSAGTDPTAFLGAALPEINGTYVLGSDERFVAESCEYCRSFLHLHPKVAVILNVEADHLDYYSGIEEIIGAFRDFACKTPADGTVVVNGSSANAMRAVAGIDRRIVTFGGETSDYTAADLSMERGCWSYTLTERGEPLCRIRLAVPGRHNVDNSLAAAAALRVFGFDAAQIADGISTYAGVLRRFQRLGSFRGADVVDDYAHHPDELEATLRTALSYGYKRVICLFQPHTYSRTAALRERFCEVLRMADIAVLTDIYAAREADVFGISSKDLADAVAGAVYAPSLEDAADCLASLAEPGDLILTCGAGSVDRAAQLLLDREGGVRL